MHRHRKDQRKRGAGGGGRLGVLWHSFWHAPDIACPRCGSRGCDYYDPFFFSPLRTLGGRRRIKCRECRFVWRPSSRGRSMLETLNPFRIR